MTGQCVRSASRNIQLTDVVQVVIDWCQGRYGVRIAHGGCVRFINAGDSIATAVEANRSFARAFGLLAPAFGTLKRVSESAR